MDNIAIEEWYVEKIMVDIRKEESCMVGNASLCLHVPTYYINKGYHT